MAPIQTFSSSPITAKKADAATAPPAQPADAHKTSPASAAAPAPSASASRYGPPTAAQPASRPSIPVPTSSGTSQQPPQGAIVTGGHPQPTPTQPIQDAGHPPAPQPGAVPTAPGQGISGTAGDGGATTTSTLPPPPKKGGTLGPEHTLPQAGTSGSRSTHAGGYPPPTTMPAQMGYAPPAVSHSIRGTSTTAATAGVSPYASGPVQLPLGGGGLVGAPGSAGGVNMATDMSHPPGYQQDVHAAEFSSGQRAAHNAYVAQNSDFAGGLAAGDSTGESIWNTAKKWASAAGDSLAAAESEVWKAVNKDQK